MGILAGAALLGVDSYLCVGVVVDDGVCRGGCSQHHICGIAALNFQRRNHRLVGLYVVVALYPDSYRAVRQVAARMECDTVCAIGAMDNVANQTSNFLTCFIVDTGSNGDQSIRIMPGRGAAEADSEM